MVSRSGVFGGPTRTTQPPAPKPLRQWPVHPFVVSRPVVFGGPCRTTQPTAPKPPRQSPILRVQSFVGAASPTRPSSGRAARAAATHHLASRPPSRPGPSSGPVSDRRLPRAAHNPKPNSFGPASMPLRLPIQACPVARPRSKCTPLLALVRDTSVTPPRMGSRQTGAWELHGHRKANLKTQTQPAFGMPLLVPHARTETLTLPRRPLRPRPLPRLE